MGLLILFILAGGLLLLLGTLVIVHAVLRPPRTTFAEALAIDAPTDPGDLQLDYTVWACRTADGLDLPAWDVVGASGGPTLIWLHDHGRSRICDLSDIEYWLGWCGRVVLVDLRGHGDADGACTLGQRERDDIDRLIDHVQAEQLILAGRGFGALLAVDAAQRHDDIAVWGIEPRGDATDEIASALRSNHLPAWPLSGLTVSVASMLGCRPMQPVSAASEQRVRIVDAGAALPEGPWWP